MNLGILSRINHGYDDLEPIVLGLMAMNKSFMLIGRHGTGKTRLARMLSRGYGEGGFAFYDATKDDLISIAGIPDAGAISGGSLRFVPHERSIWNKVTIVVDEITRAGKESQNLWLEILEDRTCFGLPLVYRTLIATANPESYAAAFQLDEALLDRFYAVLPVPEMQEGIQAEDVAVLIRLSSDGRGPEPEEIARVFLQIQQAHAELLAEGARERVERYLGKLVPELLAALARSEPRYVSARTYARNLPEAILAAAAYFRVAGADEPLRRGAVEALRYGIATKLHIKPVVLELIHRALEGLLGDGTVPDTERLRLEFTGMASFEDRLDYLERHWSALSMSLREDELEKILGTLLSGTTGRGERDKLVALRATLDRLGYAGDALRQLDGQLILAFRQAVGLVRPGLSQLTSGDDPSPMARKARANILAFLDADARGAILGDHSPEAVRLKRHLIDILEGDASSDVEALQAFFAELQLASEV